jgi:tetratricopeptide (TPR) repeat protein
LRKAVAIREDLVREDPGNREDLFRLAVAYRRLGVMLVSTGELHPALDITQKGQTILEGLLQTEPRSFTLLDEMESIYETIGDIYGGNGLSANLGDTETALAYHRKALASAELRAQIAPGNVGALHGIGTYNIKVGDDLVKQGERAAALSSYNKALEIYKGLSAGGDSQRFQRQTSLLYTRIGDVHLMDGEPRPALADYIRAQEIAEKLAAADSQDALARSDATLGRGLLGKVYAELGQTEKGQAMLNNAIAALEDAVARDPQRTDAYRALGLFYMWRGQVREKTGAVEGAIADHQRNASLLERIYNADPKDVEARVTLAATRVKIGGLLAKKGNARDAMQAYQNALPDLEPFTAEKPFNIEALYAAADAYAHIGELVQRQAESAPSSPHQLELWRGARSWYEKSSVTWRKVRNPGKMTPTGFRAGEPGKAEAGLAACDTALAGPGRGLAKNATP